MKLRSITAAYVAVVWLGAGAWAQQQMVADTRPPASTQTEPRPEITDELRGDIFMARKMFREAIDRYEMVKPASPVIYNKIGIAYQQLQQLRDAEKWYKRAVKLDKTYSQAVNNLGTVYYARKSYRKATGQYEKALKLAPENASFISNLAVAWFARKKYERASELLAQAIAIDPNILENKGTTGTTLLDRSIEERAKFHYTLAKTYAQSGQLELVLLYMRKALEEGFKERDKFVKEPAFAQLQEVPEFQELLKLEPRVL